MLVTSICPAPSFATASTISHFLWKCTFYLMVLAILMAKHSIVIAILIIYSSSSSSLLFRRATPPPVFVTEPWMRCQNVRPNRESCAMTFISDRGYDVCPRGKIGANQTHWLTLRKTLTPRSSESGFHRNVKLPHFKRLAGSVRPYLKMG